MRRIAHFMLAGWLLVGLSETDAAKAEAVDGAETASIALGNLKVADFTSVPKLTGVKISPDGRYVAGLMALFGLRVLWGDDVTDARDKPFLIQGDDWDITRIDWISNDHLLVRFRAPYHINGTPITVTRMSVVNPRTGKNSLLFRRDTDAFNYQLQDRVLSLLPDQPDRFLVELRGRKGVFGCVVTVKRRGCRSRVRTAERNVESWLADRDGVVRAGMGFQYDQKSGYMTLRDAAGNWHDYSSFADDLGTRLIALPTDDLDTVFVLSEHEQPLGALYRLNVLTRQMTYVAGHQESAISSVTLRRDGRGIERISYSSEFVADDVRDKELERMQKSIDKALPDYSNHIVTRSDDSMRAIVRSQAANVPSHYYYFDRKLKVLSFLLSNYPALDEVELPHPVPFSYKARDGLEIPAYLTLPLGFEPGESKPIPFVVHPHGGPHARDFLRFDWLAQLMVQAGYGVLQMNFRGSSGYGSAFQRAGQREWGQAMQDDITDGTRWLIEEGFARADRICLVGGSYGGYAALMGLAKVPALYRCSVSFNGVTDLPSLLRQARRYLGGRYATRHIGNLWRDRDQLVANSPRRLVDRITAPILLMHGENDRVVDVSHSRRMYKALQRVGADVRYVELPDGNHNLSLETNRRRFGEELVAFLQQHLSVPVPAGGSTAAAGGQ